MWVHGWAGGLEARARGREEYSLYACMTLWREESLLIHPGVLNHGVGQNLVIPLCLPRDICPKLVVDVA